jgi:outer membrane immunogenic protein
MLAVMKRLLATGIAVIALAAPAQAAKSATKEPAKPVAQAVVAAPAPAFSWTGCYVGGHLGGGWGHKNFSDPAGFELSNGSPAFTPPPPLYPGTSTVSLPLDQQVSGFLGGAQVGCKYQFASKWVVGIDGAFSKARLIGTTAWNLTPFGTAPPIIVPATFQAEVDWLASTTATLGYSFDRLLFYAKGGMGARQLSVLDHPAGSKLRRPAIIARRSGRLSRKRDPYWLDRRDRSRIRLLKKSFSQDRV